MIHGTQKMTLTHASVAEAIEDYLAVHFASTVEVRLKSWQMTPGSYAPDQSIDIEFEQTPEKQASNLLSEMAPHPTIIQEN